MYVVGSSQLCIFQPDSDTQHAYICLAKQQMWCKTFVIEYDLTMSQTLSTDERLVKG